MEEDRRRDRRGEVYRPADQEEGGSNSDAAPPTDGGVPVGSSPPVLLRSALGRIVQMRHGGRQGGVRINPYRQWERGRGMECARNGNVSNRRTRWTGPRGSMRPWACADFEDTVDIVRIIEWAFTSTYN